MTDVYTTMIVMCVLYVIPVVQARFCLSKLVCLDAHIFSIRLIITTICYYCMISAINRDAGLCKSQHLPKVLSDFRMLFTVLRG